MILWFYQGILEFIQTSLKLVEILLLAYVDFGSNPLGKKKVLQAMSDSNKFQGLKLQIWQPLITTNFSW